ncbi:hypothetical protein PQ472_10740 [Lacticaseibacillus pabuli]|uniref:Uncharacterized protein n=1 Tax=Lacticaseibacillus pabuli TaxID=3025672 RepID=A0ABY7WQ83_9LACO|nr:hypothetical protein [Lacticaseibacillus sp. KACC 23028]WDF82353.1 hypothetical protein PQ472_10740 [Lacticaseibacillus sp. KACC 23028]
MRATLGLVLLGGVLLIIGIFRTRKSLRNSSSARLAKAILVLGAAFWIVAGGHALLVNASTDASSITQPQRGIHPQTKAKAQTDYALPQQKDNQVALQGKVVGIRNGQHNAPTYLLVARNGNEKKLIAVRVDRNSALGNGVALNHNVTVRGVTGGSATGVGYKDVPTVTANRVVKADFSNSAA